MNQENIERELTKITTELEVIEKSMTIEFQSVGFLSVQADILLKKVKDDSIPLDEKEQIYKQMDALYTRMKLEEKMILSRGVKVDELEKRFNELIGECQ